MKRQDNSKRSMEIAREAEEKSFNEVHLHCRYKNRGIESCVRRCRSVGTA